MQAKQNKPFILTVRLDEASQLFFNELRKRYFPPERNYLEAHLTLFHQLPHFPDQFRYERFDLQVTVVYSIGNGVAYRLESAMLLELHRCLSRHFGDILIPQDRKKFVPHITIQNRVDPTIAKQTLLTLTETFKPFRVKALGLDLWSYSGGPWRHEQFYSFRNEPSE